MSADAQTDILNDRHLVAAALRVPSFEEALARLLYVVEHRRPCGLVVGLAGTGKSVLLKAVFQELSSPQLPGMNCRPVLINLQAIDGSAIAWTIGSELGLSPRDHARQEHVWRAIEDRFQGAGMSGNSLAFLIDHLNQTDREALIGLNRCCHLAVRYESTVLLTTRPHANSPLVEVVGPLCDLRVELPLWSVHETAAFVTELFHLANFARPTDETIEAIQAAAGGRMRDTVRLLRLSLYAAQAQGLDCIDQELVRTVAGEIWEPPRRSRCTHPC